MIRTSEELSAIICGFEALADADLIEELYHTSDWKDEFYMDVIGESAKLGSLNAPIVIGEWGEWRPAAIVALKENAELISSNILKEIAQLIKNSKISAEEQKTLVNALKRVIGIVLEMKVRKSTFSQKAINQLAETDWFVHLLCSLIALDNFGRSIKSHHPHVSTDPFDGFVLSNKMVEVDKAVEIWFSSENMHEPHSETIFTTLEWGLSVFYGSEKGFRGLFANMVSFIFSQDHLIKANLNALVSYNWESTISLKENLLDCLSQHYEEWEFVLSRMMTEWESDSKTVSQHSANHYILDVFCGISLSKWLNNEESLISGSPLEEYILNMEFPPQ
jgi:hypothetical protein